VGAYYYYFNKKNKTISTSKSVTSCSFNLIPQAIADSPNNISLNTLVEKMKTYQNYQLDVNTKLTSSEINWTILRAGEKYTLSSKDLSDIVDYLDCDNLKNYSLVKQSNKYADLSNEASSILSSGVGRPEYYFRSWPQEISEKGKDEVNSQKVIVYSASANNIEYTAYISAETGLPLKMITKSTKEIVTNLEFSRLGNVNESEVTIPSSAEKYTDKEVKQGEEFIDKLTRP